MNVRVLVEEEVAAQVVAHSKSQIWHTDGPSQGGDAKADMAPAQWEHAGGSQKNSHTTWIANKNPSPGLGVAEFSCVTPLAQKETHIHNDLTTAKTSKVSHYFWRTVILVIHTYMNLIELLYKCFAFPSKLTSLKFTQRSACLSLLLGKTWDIIKKLAEILFKRPTELYISSVICRKVLPRSWFLAFSSNRLHDKNPLLGFHLYSKLLAQRH